MYTALKVHFDRDILTCEALLGDFGATLLRALTTNKIPCQGGYLKIKDGVPLCRRKQSEWAGRAVRNGPASIYRSGYFELAGGQPMPDSIDVRQLIK